MKNVLIETKFDEKIPYLMLDSIEDVIEYSGTLCKGVENTLKRLISSKVDISRWDHMVGRNDPDGVMGAAITKSWIIGTNPIYEVGPIADQKIKNMLNSVQAGETILVNSVGGYCPFTEGYHKIIEESEYVSVRERTYVINKNTKYINLENDPKLEEHTIEYLTSIDPNYSYICELREYDVDELVKIFKEFQDNGGDTVYVYTTGINVVQMFEYSDAIIQSGIKKVEFEFNAGYDEEHDDVIKLLKTNDVDVSVKYV